MLSSQKWPKSNPNKNSSLEEATVHSVVAEEAEEEGVVRAVGVMNVAANSPKN